MPKTFRGLPKRQAEVFERIATGFNRGHHPATIKALLSKGLIEATGKVVGHDRFGPIEVFFYEVPIPTHMEWAQWCSDNFDFDEDGNATPKEKGSA